MLTLIDSLDSLLLFREYDLFFDALHKLKDLTFHRNLDVSVFEVNIRVLGGLLSAHQLASVLLVDDVGGGISGDRDDGDDSGDSDSSDNSDDSGDNTDSNDNSGDKDGNKDGDNSGNRDDHSGRYYDGRFLLDLAIDIGNRMLPAFDTETGSGGMTVQSAVAGLSIS